MKFITAVVALMLFLVSCRAFEQQNVATAVLLDIFCVILLFKVFEL